MNGKTGWMMVAAVRKVCMMDSSNMPLSVGVETADFAVMIHGGHEVQLICDMLRQHYVVYMRVLAVAPYGSVSHRKRLFINAFDKSMPGCDEWEWPTGHWDEHHPHCARDIADEDKDVPVDARLPVDFTIFCSAYHHDRKPAFGEMQKLARVKEGMGHSSNPHLHLGLDGVPNGPTRYGGGGTRGSTEWEPGRPIAWKAKWSLGEFYKIAGLPESAMTWHSEWRSQSSWTEEHSDFQDFLRAGVNQGYPAAATYCLEGAVAKHMLKHGVQPDMPAQNRSGDYVTSTMWCPEPTASQQHSGGAVHQTVGGDSE